MSHSQRVKWSELNNGLLTLDKDSLIADTLVISNPTIKYSLEDQDVDNTVLTGQGCYRTIRFESTWDEYITVSYSSHLSKRTDVAEDAFSVAGNELSYRKVGNKSSVVPDEYRESINFNQVTDVDALGARYIMLQQFIGSRLASKYVVSRAMDDYFANYWDGEAVNYGVGSIEQNVPWLRMNIDSGDRLYAGDMKLTVVINDMETSLSPTDDILNDVYIQQSNAIAKMTPISVMPAIISHVNTRYTEIMAKDANSVGNSFAAIDNVLSLKIDDVMHEMDWANAATSIVSRSAKVLSALDNTTPYTGEIAKLEIDAAMTNVITINGTGNTIIIDEVDGSIIKVGGKELHLLGNRDLINVNTKVSLASKYLVPADSIPQLALGRRVKGILSHNAKAPLINRVAANRADMIDYLK